MPKFAEVARLAVGNMLFEDWDTVYVQHRWQDGWPTFRFSCAERAPLPTFWTLMQFKPGMSCQIFLGGILAITGIITQRQTTYDSKSHGVLISGVGRQWLASTSSVNSEDANFDNMSLEQIAKKVFGAAGATVKVIGVVDPTPFPRASAQPGELVFDFVDKYARMRGASVGTDHEGNILLIGSHTSPVTQELFEGQNILRMQCVFSNEQLAMLYRVKGQTAVDDAMSARQSSHMQAEIKGSLNHFKYLETVVEQPVRTMVEMHMRATYDASQREGTKIRAYVTVQGWLRDGVTLWRTGDNVWVYSPMAMLNMIMKIQNATFTQDDRGGTITVLELVIPWMLGDRRYTTKEPAPQPPDGARTSSDDPSALIQI